MNPGTRQALSNPEAPGLQTALKRKNYLEGAQRTLTEGTHSLPKIGSHPTLLHTANRLKYIFSRTYATAAKNRQAILEGLITLVGNNKLAGCMRVRVFKNSAERHDRPTLQYPSESSSYYVDAEWGEMFQEAAAGYSFIACT